jgi:hypothetical protein
MKYKWNWGTKIALLYGSFVVFIGTMVYLSFGEKFDLVTEDYYAEEIAYQETINKRSRANALKENLTVSLQTDEVTVNLPVGSDSAQGTVFCFRPSEQAYDFQWPFQDSRTVVIPREKFVAGKYRFKVEWESGGNTYYQEQTVVIP